MRALLPLLSVLLLSPAACRVVESRQSANPTPVVRRAEAVRAWTVVQDGEEHGSVIRFRDAVSGSEFYSVRNAWNQDLGLVDDVGRAWAFRPHEPEPVWLGSGTVAEGAGRILALEGGCELVETPLGGVEEPDDGPGDAPDADGS